MKKLLVALTAVVALSSSLPTEAQIPTPAGDRPVVAKFEPAQFVRRRRRVRICRWVRMRRGGRRRVCRWHWVWR